MTGERVDAVLLDAGGVLILPEHDVMRASLRPYGVEPSDGVLTRAHYAAMAAREADLERPWAAYARAYAEACGVRAGLVGDAADALFVARPEWTSPTPWAGDLRRLVKLGIEVAVVSNAVGTVEWQLRTAGVCQVGDGAGVPVRAVIDSHLVGVRKPDPAIFALGLDAVGTTREHALMVGDYALADVWGAERAGIRAVHLDPYGDCRTTHAAPDVPDLAAVVELVRQRHAR
ncbi:MAG: HAD hydrolase-like protein [Streptosporangiales bacterium]|nr:HAD hydrolase-like protein [Streptosporangiales bacterium]